MIPPGEEVELGNRFRLFVVALPPSSTRALRLEIVEGGVKVHCEGSDRDRQAAIRLGQPGPWVQIPGVHAGWQHASRSRFQWEQVVEGVHNPVPHTLVVVWARHGRMGRPWPAWC